jgi:hypothetical protein
MFFNIAAMAIYPTDFNSEIMSAEHGTVVLVTSPIADKYLQKAKTKQYSVPEDRYSRPCGGSGGFDDFVERWHE